MEHAHDPQGAPWRLDLAHERLWRGTEVCHLRPKSFAVLRYLVTHPERVITKDELVQAVWPDTAVSDGVLTVCLAELRKALGDATQTPQYIETVPHAGIVSLLCGDRQAVQGHAATLVRLATEQGLTLMVGQGLLLQGWAVAAQGQTAEGLAQMQQGQTVIQASGLGLGQAFVAALLAEQYGRAGQAAAGVHMLREALAMAQTQGLRIWEAELYRLRGVLLHQAAEQGSAPIAAPEAEAERCLRQVLDIARHQGAKGFELRAALSLSRLWQQQGKGAAARQLLAEVYGWFTEGFDTADLREAAALLNALT